MSVAQLHATAVVETASPIRLRVIDGDVRLDEEWIPYAQGTIRVPYDARMEGLDPQASDIWVSIDLARSGGRTDRIMDLTLRWGPRPLAAITGEFQGEALTAMTASLYHDYQTPGAARDDIRRPFRLMLREVRIDHAAAEVTLRLASGEARVEDWAYMVGTADRAPGADLAEKINHVLRWSTFPEGLTSRPAVVPTDAQMGDEAVRAPGQTGTDFIQQMTRQHGLMCWCDETGAWHLAPSRRRPTSRTLTSFGPDRSVTSATEVRSRDQDWVTAVMLIYTWQGQTYYDIASDWAPDPERAKVIRYTDRAWPGTGRAAAMLRSLRTRGRSLQIDAVTDPRVTPGETVRVTTRTGTRSGICAAVQWRLAADEMTLRLREVA